MKPLATSFLHSPGLQFVAKPTSPYLLSVVFYLLSPIFYLLSPISAVAAPPAATVGKVTPSPPVKARLWCIPADAPDPATAKRKAVDATLVGRDRTNLVTAPDESGQRGGRIPTATIAAVDFALDYDRFEVTRAMAKNDWPKAIRILREVYEPTYLYLDLPENNAAEGALDLGTTMMKFARRTARGAKDADERAKASQQYDAAYRVFQACSKAEWSSVGALGILKGCRCLLAVDAEKAKTARRRVEEMEEPTPGDDSYGHYWLLKAELAQLGGDVTNAMDAAVKSVCFENKDVETFPDALMLTADCYERLGNFYRARDVYFEVAKLFPDTDWSADALVRLEAILASGKTQKKEAATAESTFFGLEEDMNALAEALVKERKTAKNTFAKEYEEDTE